MRASIRFALALLVTVALLPIPLLTVLFTIGEKRACARAGAFGMHLWCKALCRLLDVRIEVRGTVPDGTCLFTPNHLGYFDILLLGAIYRCQFVAMSEVRSWPMFGFLSRLAGTLYIDRKRVKDVDRVAKEMAGSLALGIPITVFLEGKASSGAAVDPFRGSLLEVAVKQQIPCVPVTLWLDAPHRDLAPSTTLAWWGDMTFMPHLLRLFSLPYIRARVTFGEPVAPGDDRKALAAELHRRVSAAFEPLRQDPPQLGR